MKKFTVIFAALVVFLSLTARSGLCDVDIFDLTDTQDTVVFGVPTADSVMVQSLFGDSWCAPGAVTQEHSQPADHGFYLRDGDSPMVIPNVGEGGILSEFVPAKVVCRAVDGTSQVRVGH